MEQRTTCGSVLNNLTAVWFFHHLPELGGVIDGFGNLAVKRIGVISVLGGVKLKGGGRSVI